MNIDMFEIKQLNVSARIGVASWEQQVDQKLKMDIIYPIDSQLAAKDDDINQTCDYAAVSQAVIDFCAANAFHLLESLGVALCQHLLTMFSVEWVQLRIQKAGAVLAADHVALNVSLSQKCLNKA